MQNDHDPPSDAHHTSEPRSVVTVLKIVPPELPEFYKARLAEETATFCAKTGVRIEDAAAYATRLSELIFGMMRDQFAKR